MKCVAILSSFSGRPNCSLPSAILFIKNVMLRASVRIVCRPSPSCSASPGAQPWMLFQYWLEATGMPEIVNGEAVYNCPPEEFAALVPEMLKAGVALFGGCCGTTEEHIAALKAALKDAEYVRPAPECLGLLPAATEKEAFFLPADATHGAVLTADGDLEDKLSDAMDDEWPMVALKLASWADVDALADYQYMLRKPLCLICDDAELLEAGLRAYQGRALYEGNLTEDALAPLVEKYGLLV